jgi:hypothetical protein
MILAIIFYDYYYVLLATLDHHIEILRMDLTKLDRFGRCKQDILYIPITLFSS